MSQQRGVNVKLYMELYKRCPKEQLRFLRKVESKHKIYIEKINSMPAQLPKIDWEHYKHTVRPDYVNMVNDFETKYKAFEVPMPEETASKEIEVERCEVEKMIEEFTAQKFERIAELEEEIRKANLLVPYDQITWEEFMERNPDIAPNFIKNPTFWPHFPEEQEIGPPKGVQSDH